MTEDLRPDDGLIRRLRALGQTPVDAPTQSRHLTAMAQAAAETRFGSFASRLRVAGALVVGFLAGTTGLASAGALGPLQPIAHTTLDKVGVNVPKGDDAGTERYRGPECSTDVTYKNHGQYVKAMKAKGVSAAELAESDCGKPVASLNGGDDEEKKAGDAAETDAEQGKPESPGKSEEKKADAADKGDKGKSKGEATADDAKAGASGAPAEPGKAEAECAGGTDNGVGAAPPSTTPVTPTTAHPECADDQKDASASSADDAGDEGTEKSADAPDSQEPAPSQEHEESPGADS